MRASRSRLYAPAAGTAAISPEAANGFRFDLIDRFAAGKLDPIDLATIAWRATAAGAEGVADLAVDPNQKGANHARKIRDALGLDAVKDQVLYELRIPVWCVATAARVVSPMFVKLPHEALMRDYQNNKIAYDEARQDLDNIDVPAFIDHPTALQFGKDARWPCGYYTDKVKLGNESFYRGSVKCTVMRSSVTVWLFKCSELCRCGCNGLCTMDALQMEMNWSFNALQNGRFMASRFDQRNWLPSDANRQQRAGQEMGFRGVVNEYRADLPERCLAARVKNHTGHFGCLGCLSTSDHLHDRVAEVSFCSVPWEPRSHNQYLAEVSSHLVAVTLHTAADRDELTKALKWLDAYPWGRRVQGKQGSRWGLAPQDQLIVSDAVRSPYCLDTVATPCVVFFFRPRKQSSISGVSLLFNIPGVHTFGIDHFEVLHIAECTLHTLDLGLAQRFCATAMVKALKCNIYKLKLKAIGPLVFRGCMHMNKDIKKFYRDEKKLNPWKKMSTLSKTFSHVHLGKLNRPCLKAKGGQTRVLVKFCTELMNKYDLGKQGRLLAKAGASLMDLYATMAEEPRRVSLAGRHKMVESVVNHVVFYRAAGGHLVYKHHGAIHLACMAGFQGNPRHVSTYEDEHENGVIARIGLHVHGSTFAKSIFERIELHNADRRMLPVIK